MGKIMYPLCPPIDFFFFFFLGETTDRLKPLYLNLIVTCLLAFPKRYFTAKFPLQKQTPRYTSLHMDSSSLELLNLFSSPHAFMQR